MRWDRVIWQLLWHGHLRILLVRLLEHGLIHLVSRLLHVAVEASHGHRSLIEHLSRSVASRVVQIVGRTGIETVVELPVLFLFLATGGAQTLPFCRGLFRIGFQLFSLFEVSKDAVPHLLVFCFSLFARAQSRFFLRP
jgi:hypothetical protein